MPLLLHPGVNDIMALKTLLDTSAGALTCIRGLTSSKVPTPVSQSTSSTPPRSTLLQTQLSCMPDNKLAAVTDQPRELCSTLSWQLHTRQTNKQSPTAVPGPSVHRHGMPQLNFNLLESSTSANQPSRPVTSPCTKHLLCQPGARETSASVLFHNRQSTQQSGQALLGQNLAARWHFHPEHHADHALSTSWVNLQLRLQTGWHSSTGVRPCLLVTLLSAPPASKARTTSTWPRIAAQCSALLSPCTCDSTAHRDTTA